MQGLEGQVALVTGGGSGIGRAIVHRLAAAGATVIAADVDGAAAEAVVYEVDEPGKVMALQMDVADAASVQGGVEAVHQTAGFVSVLVNNAGVGTAGTVLTTQPDDFWRMMAVNVYGTFLVTRAVLPDMLQQHAGTIVNVASVAGLVGIQNRAAYSASKGAVLALTRSLHADFHKEGIRVNAVVPGTVNTPWVERITRMEADPEAAVAAMAARQPIGRMGVPEEIAEAVYFLATPMSRFVYGSWLVVDGGLTAL